MISSSSTLKLNAVTATGAALPAASTAGRPGFARRVARIARKEFGDRLGSGWILASLAVWLGAVCLTSFFGLVQIGQLGVQGYERTVMSLVGLAQYLVPLLGLLVAHDLVVSEREDRTLPLLVASGVTRPQLLVGKLLGAACTLCLPLVLGFVISGVVIVFKASSAGLPLFVRMAAASLGLGLVFVAAGLFISTLARNRVQALVFALLTWCMAVFVFDLVALGVIVATRSEAAAQEIEAACDPTSVADIHAAFDTPAAEAAAQSGGAGESLALRWVLLNPVDLFRAVNLPSSPGLAIPGSTAAGLNLAWIGTLTGLAIWKFRRIDL